MDGPVSPLCSRNARSQKTLVGRAQWGTLRAILGDNVDDQAWKDYLWSLAAALLDSLFEHPAIPSSIFHCLQRPHDKAVVVRRAQLGTKPGHPKGVTSEQ